MNNRLVFIEKTASAVFWDDLWASTGDLKRQIMATRKNNLICQISKKFLNPGSTILEGGCGTGKYVYALNNYAGYNAYGVDLAESTVSKINELFPNLQIQVGDVRSLPFKDDFFDGYWSLGVIEHFYDGYDGVLSEMKRVLKKGGFLFITFPHLSLLRKLKIKFKLYQDFVGSEEHQKDFYQFALADSKVISDLEKCGFVLKMKKNFDAVKGFKDEVPTVKFVLQPIYDSRFLLLRCVKHALDKLLSCFSSHMVLLVLELKNK